MSIRVGLLTEGHDHFVIRSYLAKLLMIPEDKIEPDVIDGTGHGWEYVARTIDSALRRFYGRCDHFAVLEMDNDGNLDLRATGASEDPQHPRHSNHASITCPPTCRWGLLSAGADVVRPALNWIPTKPGDRWPIVIAVPVESLEAWLLITQAIVHPGRGSLHAEQEARSNFKMRLYGRPAATIESVQNLAVPLIRALDEVGLETLRKYSRSFDNFAAQVGACAEEILTVPSCW